MPYRVIILAAGNLDQIEWQATPIVEPQEGEVLVRVEAAGAAFGDVLLRRGVAGGRFPVTPGYDFVGIVEALGRGSSRFKVGARVVGFPGEGGQQEHICVSEDELAPVPDGIAPEKAVALVLNYLTALQLLTRSTHLKEGDTAFIYGLAGGVGSAIRQLAAPLGIRLFGTASSARLAQASEGATAFDRGKPNWPAVVRRVCPGGFDAVFDPIGGASLNRSYRLLSRRGTLVMIGAASSVQGSRHPRLALLGTLLRFASLKLRPGLRRVRIFLVEGAKKNPARFQSDMAQLFQWLEDGTINPRIDAVLPLWEAQQAQEMLERGDVVGKIVLERRHPPEAL